jgi:hypothetical protein
MYELILDFTGYTHGPKVPYLTSQYDQVGNLKNVWVKREYGLRGLRLYSILSYIGSDHRQYHLFVISHNVTHWPNS